MAKKDIIMYSQFKPINQLAALTQKLFGVGLVPLAVSRVSNRIYILVNNTVEKTIEVFAVLLPKWIQPGVKDMADIIIETEAEKESDPEN